MRKIAVLAATAAVIAAGAGLWSSATFDKPKVAGHVQATEAPPVSPHEIMVKQVQMPSDAHRRAAPRHLPVLKG
jgi:hypothetical protein